MKEIGGYFGLEQLVSNEYYKNLIPLNTARYSLLYILKAKNIKKIYLPTYLCNVVRDMCLKYSYEIEYYCIGEDFLPIFDKNLAKDEYIFIVNYFGQITDEKILLLRDRFERLVLDNAQSFFQRPLNGVDTIYSCRKFFGVPEGAYLSTVAKLNEEIEVDISKNRMTHILGRFEGEASDYFQNYQEHKLLFDDEPLKYMSKLSHNILGAIDYDNAARIRNENYVYLASKLGKLNRLSLVTPEGPFAYPFYIKNGIEVRKKLAKKKIYIPILWPNALDETPQDSVEHDYVANILPLPCDQRYGIDEMKFMVSEVSKYTA
ncbi:MAG: hypothetical protein QM220_05235 [Atribacterota bacterium]|nr:hypothetical protein [Atribacterota bacterium]